MIGLLVPWLGAVTATGCTPVPGAERLWLPPTRWVIVGEMHGTNETPDALANLACLAAAAGRPVTVAVEYSVDDQPTIDAYLASDGKDGARSALLTLPVFRSPMQDGRGSVAFVRLWDRLRQMKQAGTITGVIATDTGRSTPSGQDRNAWMAQRWSAIRTGSRGIVLALVGNAHAMRRPVTFFGRTIVPAGALMPVGQTITVNVVGSGGTAWNCQNDGCAAHENGSPRKVAAGIAYSTDADRQWDAVYELGIPTTAAMPAVTMKALPPATGMRLMGEHR